MDVDEEDKKMARDSIPSSCCSHCKEEWVNAKVDAMKDERLYMSCGGENFPPRECELGCGGYLEGDPPSMSACDSCAKSKECCAFCLR